MIVTSAHLCLCCKRGCLVSNLASAFDKALPENAAVLFLNRQVSFLNQESMVETIQKAIERELMESNTTRTFYTQVGMLSFIALSQSSLISLFFNINIMRDRKISHSVSLLLLN